jgi:hypothetical protein
MEDQSEGVRKETMAFRPSLTILFFTREESRERGGRIRGR